jgi:hypothetical protein
VADTLFNMVTEVIDSAFFFIFHIAHSRRFSFLHKKDSRLYINITLTVFHIAHL